MKKMFKKAHKMTREMVEKYGVDYQLQFGLNLSYLLKNKEVITRRDELVSKKAQEFNNFRFKGLNWGIQSNKYLTMTRVSEIEDKIVVKVADSHLIETRFGFALILDNKNVVFLKEWQVDKNWFGNEVVLDRNYWNVKEWGNHEEFSIEEKNYDFNSWVETAKEQKETIVKIAI